MDALVRFEERRTSERRPVFKNGEVTAADKTEFLLVAVKDLSETGAGLETVNAGAIPDNFELLIIEDCLLYNVAVKWRKADRLGVEFLGAPRKVLTALR
jgi:hypothetical protein